MKPHEGRSIGDVRDKSAPTIVRIHLLICIIGRGHGLAPQEGTMNWALRCGPYIILLRRLLYRRGWWPGRRFLLSFPGRFPGCSRVALRHLLICRWPGSLSSVLHLLRRLRRGCSPIGHRLWGGPGLAARADALGWCCHDAWWRHRGYAGDQTLLRERLSRGREECPSVALCDRHRHGGGAGPSSARQCRGRPRRGMVERRLRRRDGACVQGLRG